MKRKIIKLTEKQLNELDYESFSNNPDNVSKIGSEEIRLSPEEIDGEITEPMIGDDFSNMETSQERRNKIGMTYNGLHY